MAIPENPKIYHIVHVDRLSSIINDGFLWCDSEMIQRTSTGPIIGMSDIKQRRLSELTLTCYPDLHVGDCVPFYFCPRSIMLYLIYQANHPKLVYRGGQEPIIHLEADLRVSVEWAKQNHQRWAFTLSNAGANYFEDRCDLTKLNEINWNAVQSDKWGGPGISPSIKEGKQAEFLIEYQFPWHLVSRIGVYSKRIFQQVTNALPSNNHRPRIEVKNEWYY